jgi:phage/plasmid-associated DNA primase
MATSRRRRDDIDNPVLSDSEEDYKMRSNSIYQNSNYIELLKLLEDPTIITPKGCPDTNIVNILTKKSYNVPTSKIAKFFDCLDACRRAKLPFMFHERQLEPSGIMLDFDIMQDCDNSQINDVIVQHLVTKLIKILLSMIVIEDNTKIYVGVTKKPKVLYNEEKKVYKDGFHLIIPSIQITRAAKRYFVKYLIDNEILDRVFQEVVPASRINGYEKKYHVGEFLDENSAHVPVYFIGSATKIGNKPYKLEYVYEVVLTHDKEILISRRDDIQAKADRCEINVCREFSLNFQGTLIQKKPYHMTAEITSKLTQSATEKEPYEPSSEEITILDPRKQELKKLADILSPERYTRFGLWFQILCSLASSPSNKDIAEYFSKKWPNFKKEDFEYHWQQALRGGGREIKVNIGTFYYLAKKDNPDAYLAIKRDSLDHIIKGNIYNSIKQASFGHYAFAEILHKLLSYKYVTDNPPDSRGITYWYEFITEEDEQREPYELYKWRAYNIPPPSLNDYISTKLPEIFQGYYQELNIQAKKLDDENNKWYKTLLSNLTTSIRNLGLTPFKTNVLKEAAIKFRQYGFTAKLDASPLIRGVANGVLRLLTGPSMKPILVQGYNDYKIMKTTPIEYAHFNPYDINTKNVLLALRAIFPDDEPDTFEFFMHYISTSLDLLPKDNLFMILQGGGGNGKSFIVEMLKSTLGDYIQKIDSQFLTSFANTRGSATHELTLMQKATLVYYSEMNKQEILNIARIKEVTGAEHMQVRGMFKEATNFKPCCNHILLTNEEPKLESCDYSVLRRFKYINMKIKFVENLMRGYVNRDEYTREAKNYQKTWPKNPLICSALLSIFPWYHRNLHFKYKGSVHNINHPHIMHETMEYQKRQDRLTQFISERFIKIEDQNAEVALFDECKKYTDWHKKKHGMTNMSNMTIADQLRNSIIKSYIYNNRNGGCIRGYRFLEFDGEPLKPGEEYFIKTQNELDGSNFGISRENAEEFYSRICAEYESQKNIFDNTEELEDEKTCEEVKIRNHIDNISSATPPIELKGGVKEVPIVNAVVKKTAKLTEEDMQDMDDILKFIIEKPKNENQK